MNLKNFKIFYNRIHAVGILDEDDEEYLMLGL